MTELRAKRAPGKAEEHRYRVEDEGTCVDGGMERFHSLFGKIEDFSCIFPNKEGDRDDWKRKVSEAAFEVI